MPLILPGNVASATAATTYSIANSCRLDRASSAGLTREMDDGNEDRWTLSFWVKRGEMVNHTQVLTMGGSNHGIFFSKDSLTDALLFYNYIGGDKGQLLTTRKFRDPAAWMHLVFVWDSGNATAGNRMRIYVNGVEETAFATDTNPDQNQDSQFNVDGDTHYIGRESGGNYFDGYIAEYVFIDGTVYAASDFGEFDSDSPTIWKPKDPSGLTFGTNGVWLDFEDSSALGNDVSGNNNDFTPANLAAIDQCVDTPTNNFATLNPIAWTTGGGLTFSEGNCKLTNASSGGWKPAISTIAPTNGKWYCEIKITSSASEHHGILDITQFNDQSNYNLDSLTRAYLYYYYNGQKINNSSYEDYGDSYTTGDVIGIALDLTNNKVYFAKNGTWQDSGDPTSGATGTGAAYSITDGYDYTFALNQHNNSVSEINYGNPSWSLSSAVADANGYGAFEYAPPSGYLALCTKNLGEEG